MEKIKTFFLTSSLFVRWIISAIIVALPLMMIDTPFWLTFLVLCVVGLLDGPLFRLPSIILWIVGFVYALKGPIDFFTILFFVMFGIYAIFVVFVFAPGIISLLIANAKRNRDAGD